MAYACLDCQKSFRIAADYNRHRKQHDRPFKCQLCSRGFALKTNLNRHKLTSHSPDWKLQCKWPDCRLKTSREDYLRKHMWESHLGLFQYSDSPSGHHQLKTEIERLYQLSIGEARAAAVSFRLTLSEAVAKGEEKEVLELIAQGADVNSEFPMEGMIETPLSVSVIYGHQKIFRILLEHNPSLQSLTSAFCASICTENCHLAKALIDKGVDINGVYKAGDTKTFLQYAVVNGRDTMINFLLSRGVDVEPATIERGGSPLMYASRDGSKGIVSTLLDNGADVNRIGGYLVTSLLIATRRDEEEVVRLLLERGADPEIGKYDGTPLKQAMKYNRTAIATILREYGAKK